MHCRSAFRGSKDEALELLDPLLRRSDRAAWRDRAFILAMNGDTCGREKIAATMMSPGLGAGLKPFFRSCRNCPPLDRAFAVNFGEVRLDRRTPRRRAIGAGAAAARPRSLCAQTVGPPRRRSFCRRPTMAANARSARGTDYAPAVPPPVAAAPVEVATERRRSMFRRAAPARESAARRRSMAARPSPTSPHLSSCRLQRRPPPTCSLADGPTIAGTWLRASPSDRCPVNAGAGAGACAEPPNPTPTRADRGRGESAGRRRGADPVPGTADQPSPGRSPGAEPSATSRASQDTGSRGLLPGSIRVPPPRPRAPVARGSGIGRAFASAEVKTKPSEETKPAVSRPRGRSAKDALADAKAGSAKAKDRWPTPATPRVGRSSRRTTSPRSTRRAARSRPSLPRARATAPPTPKPSAKKAREKANARPVQNGRLTRPKPTPRPRPIRRASGSRSRAARTKATS